MTIGKTKVLGRVWTFAWFTFSLRYAASPQYERGLHAEQIPSLCRFLGAVSNSVFEGKGRLRYG